MGNKIIITGASSGFGYLAAKALVEAGHSVVGTARNIAGRNKTKAAELEALSIRVVEMDVTNDVQVEAGIKEAIDILGGLDVVINLSSILK